MNTETTTEPRSRNRSKAKGTAFETAVVRYSRGHGFPLAERRALAGNKDLGDVLLCPGVIVECKDWATYTTGDLGDWWRETAREKANANASVALLVVKRPHHGIGHAWAWRTSEWGYYHGQPLADALMELRDMGWGDAR